MQHKWNAALAVVTLSALLAACSGTKTGQDHPPGHHEESALSVSETPSSKPGSVPASPSPSASATPTVSPSATPTAAPSAAAGAKPSESPKAGTTPAASAKPSANSSTKSVSWYYMKKGKGQVPGFPAEMKQLKPNQKVAYIGTGKKVYLTFDTGGPLGDVDKMLKTLKDNHVKGNFFLAGYNVKAHPDFLERLVNDGHLVANHTMSHKDMTTLTDAQVKKEIDDYTAMYTQITGKEMVKLFRFPYGKYSSHLLDLVSEMGYTSVFWSTAMHDWEPRANGPDDAYKDIMNNLHPGNVILLHQGSEDNINALDRIIKGIRSEGYELALLTDLQK